MKTKRIILTILLIIWMSIIFIFSHQNGSESASISNNVIEKIVEVVSSLTGREYNDEEVNEIVSNYSFIIRKGAHFTIYFILASLVYLTLKSYNVNNVLLYSLVFCLLYAISDEVHQYLINGRSAEVRDVLIDFTGSTLAIMAFKLFSNKKVS